MLCGGAGHLWSLRKVSGEQINSSRMLISRVEIKCLLSIYLLWFLYLFESENISNQYCVYLVSDGGGNFITFPFPFKQETFQSAFGDKLLEEKLCTQFPFFRCHFIVRRAIFIADFAHIFHIKITITLRAWMQAMYARVCALNNPFLNVHNGGKNK